MKSIMNSCACMAGIIILFVLPANAAVDVLFYDDFQSDTAGISPTTDDLDPVIGDGDVGGYWEVTEKQPYHVQVLKEPGTGTLNFIGDANQNGTVNEADAAILAENWLAGPNATWAQGDFNEDGKVDDLDATLLAANWLKISPSPSNNYLRVLREEVSLRGEAAAIGWDSEVTENQLLELNCSVYIPSSNVTTRASLTAFDVSYVDDEEILLREFNVYFWNQDDKVRVIRWHDGNGWIDTDLFYEEDKWTDVRILADMSTATFSLTVDGQTAEGLYWLSGSNKCDLLRIKMDKDNMEAYLDNLSFAVHLPENAASVPEPAVLAYLSIMFIGCGAYWFRSGGINTVDEST